MIELPRPLPSAKDYLPDWSTTRFVVFEPTNLWTPAISAEVQERLAATDPQIRSTPVFDACHAARDVIMLAEVRSTVGFVLFLTGLERECLGILGRLARLPRQRPILIIAESVHRDLLPVLLEAGASTVLFDVKDDVPIADWCLRFLAN